MSTYRRVLAVLGALAISLFALTASATAADPASNETAAGAAAWLVTNQQPDGGFETVGFPGFETRDAALAIAEQAQTGPSWSTSQARAALAALHFGGGSGPTPLDALDDYAATITTAGEAAKTIVLSSAPLGFDPTAFDPANDGSPLNLVSMLDGGCGASTASFGTFSDTLYAIIAKRLVCGIAPSAAVSTVRAAQQADGGWNFVGDPNGAGADPDEIGLALMALVAGGATSTDVDVRQALHLLASSQQASGAWIDFFGVDGNAASTALAVLGITAAGFDAVSSCWRDTVAPELASRPYANPVAWIRAQQQPDGHIASPYDNFGVNTLTTSQLHSTPVVLATTQTDNTGHYSVTVVIPADTPLGAHEIVTRGLGPSGEERTTAVAITVEPAPVVAAAVVVVPTFAG